MEITLDQLLESRDSRSALQHELLQQHRGLTLVSLTVVMPGKVKRNFHSLIVAQAALGEMLNTFEGHTELVRTRDLPTGFEAYLLTDIDRAEAKRITCRIEDTHPLGRLFDLDVLNDDGTPLSRTELGFTSRKCLLCDHEARHCMRLHSHTQEEIHAKIKQMIDRYVQ